MSLKFHESSIIYFTIKMILRKSENSIDCDITVLLGKKVMP